MIADSYGYNFRPAIVKDAEALTHLMQASAAYQGAYASILDDYVIRPLQIQQDVFYVATLNGEIGGFYSLTLESRELDLMFVADSAQGNGLGSMLFLHMRDEAKRRGISAIKIVSHPPSVGFYQAMGAIMVGVKPPTGKVTWSRPILELTI